MNTNGETIMDQPDTQSKTTDEFQYMAQEEHDVFYPTIEWEATPEDLELFPPELYSDN